MSRIEKRKAEGKLVKFDPKKTRLKLGALKEGVKLAAKIKDWEALEAAVDGVIEEQQAFTAWWNANVTPGRGTRTDLVAARQQGSITVADATAQTGVTKSQVSKWGKRLKDEVAYREILREAAYAIMWALRSAVRGTTGTGENEWHTPVEYIDLARSVLGEFDLDPASSKAAQKTVGATEFFTEEDNGLEQEWHGRVWLNPPYAQPAIAHFVAKLIAERVAGRVTEAIMLTHNYTDTAWFQDAAAIADAICFTRGRVRFVDPEGELAAPTQGQAFFYFGDNRAKFIAGFANVGFVVVRP
jgi:phage N-6-adenine-methyltransferase